MINHYLLVTFLATIMAGDLARGETVLLGVLEDVPGVYSGESNSMKVRALFKHNGAGWGAYKGDCPDQECLKKVVKEYPHEVTWFVGLDGRQISKVVAQTPSDFSFYSHVGLQDIVDGKAPIVSEPSYEFGNFGADKLHRPLVTVSKPYFKDPAVWKPAKVTPQILSQALTALRSKVPHVCKEGPTDALVPFRYGKGELDIRAHRSARGALIMTVVLNGAYDCDGRGEGGDGSLGPHTFAISEAGKMRFLGAGLVLVDAGDYENDGLSELLFSLSRYNRGGYVLFSDALVELARFEFGYH